MVDYSGSSSSKTIRQASENPARFHDDGVDQRIEPSDAGASEQRDSDLRLVDYRATLNGVNAYFRTFVSKIDINVGGDSSSPLNRALMQMVITDLALG